MKAQLASHPKAFVGRKHILKQLNAAFEDMLSGSGKGGVILLAGEAGIGKTALVEQFRQQTVESWNRKPGHERAGRTARFAAGRCVELAAAGEPYAPFTQILDSLVRFDPKPYKEVLSRLAPKIVEGLPWVGPTLSESMDMFLERRGQQPTRSSADLSREAQNYRYVELLSALAGVTPLVLFLDDLHWADASSTNLLFSLSRRIEELPILLLGAYRPVDIEATTTRPAHPLKEAIFEMRRYGSVRRINLSYLSQIGVTLYRLC